MKRSRWQKTRYVNAKTSQAIAAGNAKTITVYYYSITTPKKHSDPIRPDGTVASGELMTSTHPSQILNILKNNSQVFKTAPLWNELPQARSE